MCTFLFATKQDIENPFRLNHDPKTGCIARLPLIVGWCLNDEEGRLAVEAKAPFVGVNFLRVFGRPGFGVERVKSLEAGPEGVMVGLNGLWSGRGAAENDEGGIGA